MRWPPRLTLVRVVETLLSRASTSRETGVSRLPGCRSMIEPKLRRCQQRPGQIAIGTRALLQKLRDLFALFVVWKTDEDGQVQFLGNRIAFQFAQSIGQAPGSIGEPATHQCSIAQEQRLLHAGV